MMTEERDTPTPPDDDGEDEDQDQEDDIAPTEDDIAWFEEHAEIGDRLEEQVRRRLAGEDEDESEGDHEQS